MRKMINQYSIIINCLPNVSSIILKIKGYIYICSHRSTNRPITEIDVNYDNIRIASVYLQLFSLQRVIMFVIQLPLNFIMSHSLILIVPEVPANYLLRMLFTRVGNMS